MWRFAYNRAVKIEISTRAILSHRAGASITREVGCVSMCQVKQREYPSPRRLRGVERRAKARCVAFRAGDVSRRQQEPFGQICQAASFALLRLG